MRMFLPFRRFLPATGSLGTRALRAGGWSLGFVFFSHALRLSSNLVMTRLLLPEAFGLMAMVGTVMTAFMLLSDIGIERSVVRDPDGETPHFLRVAWSVQIMRSSFVAGGVLVAALLLGVFGPAYAAAGTIYADPRLGWLIAISAVSPILYGLESTKKELARRRLQQGRITVLDLCSQVLSIAAMIAFAQISATVWTLMAGALTGSVFRCVATHLIFPGPRMAWVLDRKIVDRLWHYGKWLMASSVVSFVASYADRIILGALIPAATLGIYTIARVWIDAGQQVVGRLCGQVGFSSIGEIYRDRPADLPRLFRKFQMVIDGLCAAAFLATFLLGETLIDLLYTDTYVAAGGLLQILAIGILAQRFDPLHELIMIVGNSRAMVVVSLIRASIICVALPLTFNAFGLEGTLYAVALTPLSSTPYAIWVLVPTLGRRLLLDVAWLVAILVFTVTYAVITI